MAKTITVPDLGQRPEIRIVINNKEYRLTPGATVEVPDEIAATIDNIIALQPKEREPEPEPTPGPVLPEKGLVFEDYDEDGYPHSARFVGEWTSIPENYLGNKFYKQMHGVVIPEGVTRLHGYSLQYVPFVLPSTITTIDNFACFGNTLITSISFPSSLESLGDNSFRGCSNLKTVEFKGNVPNISTATFFQCTKITLYDFSHHTGSVPTLGELNALQHASGCVIRIPAALSDTTLGEGNGWESETNWVALTDIVWEVVA